MGLLEKSPLKQHKVSHAVLFLLSIKRTYYSEGGSSSGSRAQRQTEEEEEEEGRASS
jgi:hypothetical protein